MLRAFFFNLKVGGCLNIFAMQIDEYIYSLKKIRDRVDKIAEAAIKSKRAAILTTVRTRLYQKGLDGTGKLIGEYTPNTVKIKRKKNQKTSFITLRDTGTFYGSMFLEVSGRFYDINASAPIAVELVARYGESILDLTLQEQQALVQSAVDLAIELEINKLGNIDLIV
jgi:hypothetical protein